MSASGVAQKTRKQLEAERKKLKTEIRKVNKLLFDAQKKEKNALSDLKDINQKIEVRSKLIKTINLEAKALSKEIDTNEDEIEKLTKKLEALKADYAEMIFKSYKSKSQQSRTMFLLSSKNFYQAYKRLQYMKQYTVYRRKQGIAIDSQTAVVKQLNDSLLYQKVLKDTLVASEENEKEKIELDKKSQEKLITQIKRKESKYKRELRKKQRQERVVAANIDKLIKAAIAKSNAKKGVKKSKGFALTPKAKALAARFEQNKGNLPWPVESGLVVRRFGRQAHPTLRGITINSTGLHIVTDRGKSAECIFNGTVLAVQTLAQGKKNVLVQHGNYISAYKNLENSYVNTGDDVQTGQQLGTIFTDKVTGKTKLVFVLFKNSQRLNPSSWIKRR
ncbi:peptidoglycan DD-metalloendopeptidase family protein [Flavobacteriaceae bacterium S356]|uniref:Peptidoglycan DD-metalloendopeptidase family protein n=1 Tax=Asprobacillus argus TaxID=3076534 RepID=A0ABU3LBM5_9FLAO|nr:peptidoglycan DD-metalloendopeptidase family protein [Flavobacteriaceae bacterium S356]